MMLGGGLMFGIGLLIMLLVLGLPVLLVVVLAGGMTGLLHKQNRPAEVWQKPLSIAPDPVIQPAQAVAISTRYCAHCGAGLQAGWTHCPQCGAPIN